MIRYERPVSLSARWARRLARLAFLAFVGALLAHRFGGLATPGFLAVALGSALVCGLAVLLAVVGFIRLWQVAALGGFASFSALVYAALPLGAVGYGLTLYLTRPAIYDVTTDIATPPPFLVARTEPQGWLAQRPVEVLPQDRQAQLAAYPGVTGRRYDGALDRVFQGVKAVAAQTGLRIVAEEGAENARADLEDLSVEPDRDAPRDSAPAIVPVPSARPDTIAPDLPTGLRQSDILVQGEWRTLISGFRFDVAVRLREEAETTFVDLRVASRYGPHDLGLGAAFADRFLHTLDAELLGIAGD